MTITIPTLVPRQGVRALYSGGVAQLGQGCGRVRCHDGGV